MSEKNLEIYLNFSCNQKCLHCFNTDNFRKKNKSLTFSQVARSIFKMKKLGYRNLFLLGGEPTIHPDLMKIMFLAKKLRFKEITIFSNGQKFSDPEFTGKAKKAGLTNCYISMHGHKKKLHDFVTGIDGSFEKAVQAIKNLIETGTKTMVVLVLNRKNYRHLLQMMLFFNKLGIRHYMIFFLKYQGRMIEDKKKSKELMVPLSKAFENYEKIIKFSKKWGIPLPTIEHVPPCIIKNYDLSKIGDYSSDFNRKMLLQDGRIYNASKPHKGYAFKKSCRKCSYFRGCAGFDPEYAKIFGTGEFKPVTKPV